MKYCFIDTASLLAVLSLFLLGACRDERADDKTARGEIVSVLREGDIVFRRGGGLTSRAVLMADTEGIYSHTGIVVKGGMIVHIVPGEEDESGVRDVIKTESPEMFFARGRASQGAVMRIGCDSIAGVAARKAVELSAAAIPFDHDYDLDDTTRMYCTELVWRVFRHAGLDLTEGRRTKINMPGFRGDYILPIDIAVGTQLELIYSF